jgi:glyoxylase-like metal-dependent hydrolase (beta-lactamase superfamily II)
MSQQVKVGESAVVHDDGGKAHEVIENLAYRRLGLVNVALIGAPRSREWVLVDAGVRGTSKMIKHAAAERFGAAVPPKAIILTHGHFDHVGALDALLEEWNVPVYAHPIEHPYLDGSESYPPPDPTVGGGLMAAMSGLFPRGPINISQWLRMLGDGGAVPHAPGWQWLHTPGHTAGHVSLWHPESRALIAGDAFITTAQESAYAVATQRPELHGPPMYYTPDWPSAHASVVKLAELAPQYVVTGHGPAMAGDSMLAALRVLASDFDQVAVPRHGRYVNRS